MAITFDRISRAAVDDLRLRHNEFRVVVTLGKWIGDDGVTGGRVSRRELARQTRISKGRVAGVLEELATKGWLQLLADGRILVTPPEDEATPDGDETTPDGDETTPDGDTDAQDGVGPTPAGDTPTPDGDAEQPTPVPDGDETTPDGDTAAIPSRARGSFQGSSSKEEDPKAAAAAQGSGPPQWLAERLAEWRTRALDYLGTAAATLPRRVVEALVDRYSGRPLSPMQISALEQHVADHGEARVTLLFWGSSNIGNPVGLLDWAHNPRHAAAARRTVIRGQKAWGREYNNKLEDDGPPFAGEPRPNTSSQWRGEWADPPPDRRPREEPDQADEDPVDDEPLEEPVVELFEEPTPPDPSVFFDQSVEVVDEPFADDPRLEAQSVECWCPREDTCGECFDHLRARPEPYEGDDACPTCNGLCVVPNPKPYRERLTLKRRVSWQICPDCKGTGRA